MTRSTVSSLHTTRNRRLRGELKKKWRVRLKTSNDILKQLTSNKALSTFQTPFRKYKQFYLKSKILSTATELLKHFYFYIQTNKVIKLLDAVTKRYNEGR